MRLEQRKKESANKSYSLESISTGHQLLISHTLIFLSNFDVTHLPIFLENGNVLLNIFNT